MAKKDSKSSGSYSLLALLKRTLFLHETADIDELAEATFEELQSIEGIGPISHRLSLIGLQDQQTNKS